MPSPYSSSAGPGDGATALLSTGFSSRSLPPRHAAAAGGGAGGGGELVVGEAEQLSLVLAKVAHELRTPLVGVAGLLEGMPTHGLDPVQVRGRRAGSM